MNVSNVGTKGSGGVQHEAYQSVQEKANSASASETKEMGVIVEISTIPETAQRMAEAIQQLASGHNRQYFDAQSIEPENYMPVTTTEKPVRKVNAVSSTDTIEANNRNSSVTHSFVTGKFNVQKALFVELAKKGNLAASSETAENLNMMADNILSYFNMEGYDHNDVESLASQLADAAVEYGKQLENGNEELGSLKTKLIVGDTSLDAGQLFEVQSVLQKLYEQGYVTTDIDESGNYSAKTINEESLAYSWEPGTYAQLGLKTAQLSYACNKLGMSVEAKKMVTDTYRERVENTISKVNDQNNSVQDVLAQTRKKLYQMIKEKSPDAYERYMSQAKSRKQSNLVEISQETNTEIYQMFANLDVSSIDNFKLSFEKVLSDFRKYFGSDPTGIYSGTTRENIQVDELVNRMYKFL